MRQALTASLASLLRRSGSVAGVAFSGVAITLAVWLVTARSERDVFEAEYSRRAENVANRLQNGIDAYLEKLYAVRALFDSSGHVTRDEFDIFARSVLDGRPGILNLSWIPRVKHEDRAAHELAALRDGMRDYRIRITSPDGSLPISPPRAEYFPKYYSTEERGSRVYGLDLNDDGVRSATIRRVRDRNVLSISPPLTLHIGDGDRRGFWAALPVYAQGLPHDDVEDRRESLIGFVQGVFQIGVIADTILGRIRNPSNVHLYGPKVGDDDLPLYVRSLASKDERLQARPRSELESGMHRAIPIKFGDTAWTAVLTPHPSFLPKWNEKLSTAGLAFGLLFTAILTWFVYAMGRNARRLELANAKIEERNFQFDAALNNMTQGLMMFDSAGKLIVSNRRIAELFGFRTGVWSEAALGKSVADCVRMLRSITGIKMKNAEQVLAELAAHRNMRQPGRLVFERENGQILSSLFSPMQDGSFVLTFSDITDRRRAEDKISHMAHYDMLTDLPNRARFYERMEKLLKSGPASAPFAVFSLDLDRFKSINDTLGHPVGDKLLQAVAGRMRSCIRDTDIVARLGGDEFAILQVPFVTPDDAAALATRIIESVGAPYRIDGHKIVVGTSAGIARAPQDGGTPEELMKNADLALYRCKEESGGCYNFFDAGMGERMRARHTIEADMRKALADDEFTLHYQPVIDLATGAVSACEALIRWNHATRGWVSPAEFIPIAEETGLVVPIGEWVLRRACTDAKRWPADFRVAVNVSSEQLRGTDFVETVKKVLAETGFPPSRLELELTETALMQDAKAALALFKRIKQLGVGLAMDDFGTGYSSLGYLSNFPFDKIKIDRSFISGLTDKKDCRAIVKAVVTLGRSLGMGIVAEGVETECQLAMVRSAGCTEAQGYLFSRAVPAKDIEHARRFTIGLVEAA